jgi:hypothetical protein
MKKALLYFSLFVFHFSFGQTLDTLVYNDGARAGVIIDSIGIDMIFYRAPNTTNRVPVKTSQLNYILYKEGGRYTIDRTYHDTTLFRLGPIIINAGVGMSLIEIELPGVTVNGNTNGVPELKSETPVYNFSFDWLVLKRVSFGGGIAYQSITDYPIIFNGYYANWELEKITRCEISGLLLFHFSKNPINDAYAGIRIGGSIWNEQVLYDTQGSIPGPTAWRTINSYAQNANIQLLIGYRCFLNYNFGLHADIGIGSPYIFEIGLSFRFKTRKVKA